MYKLLRFLQNYKKESILGPLFKLLEASFELLVPLVVAAIIDRGIGGADRGYTVKMCLLLAALGVVGLLSSVTAQFFAAKAAVGFAEKVRHALFKHIQSLSYSDIDSLGTSTLVTRMTSDMNQVQYGVNMTLRLLLRSPFVVFGAMMMAFTVDAKAALTFVVTIPLLSVVVFGIMLVCIPLYRKVQEKLDGVLLSTRENLTGVRVIRAFCKEEEETRRFLDRNEALTDAQKFVGRISALMNPVTLVIINGSIIALVYIGALRVDQGIITQGAVVALYNYMSQILVELIKLANLIISVTKSIACGNRIQAVLDMQPSMIFPREEDAKQGDTICEYAVEFRHADLRYGTSNENALTDIDFKVKRGETVGIIGGTGSGKSSLVNLIPRFYDTFAGDVLVNGVNVKEYTRQTLRKKIGTVPQKAVLFKGTIRDNMRWGNSSASDEEISAAIATAQASEVVTGKEGGLDYGIAQGGKNLSGGQRQRLTIARALVKKPEILILDDSASALDFATDAALRKAIKAMEGSPTVFIVSQRAASIAHADKIIVLDDGRIVGMGKHDELLKTCDVYREIYNSQFTTEKTGKEGAR
ncbi:MAG: ABC transporter ATP-binding protein [Clostridia bacterium]|nr:ABC transporter ATP-binding protein [Clostridia bacterium]